MDCLNPIFENLQNFHNSWKIFVSHEVCHTRHSDKEYLVERYNKVDFSVLCVGVIQCSVPFLSVFYREKWTWNLYPTTVVNILFFEETLGFSSDLTPNQPTPHVCQREEKENAYSTWTVPEQVRKRLKIKIGENRIKYILLTTSGWDGHFIYFSANRARSEPDEPEL